MPKQLLLELKGKARAVLERARVSVTMQGFIVNDWRKLDVQ